MSVLLPKEDNNNSKVPSSLREKAQRQKSGQTTKQQNRDSLHLINEKNATNLQATEQDDDSETENLSPLLYHKSKKSQMKHGKKSANASTTASATTHLQTQQSQSALHIDGVNESIDDTDTELDDRDIEVQNFFQYSHFLLVHGHYFLSVWVTLNFNFVYIFVV